MEKPLSEMTREELWALFPIVLVPHDDAWNEWYRGERKRLLTFLPKDVDFSINHIGSTAIGTIWAKPIVDILVEISQTASMQAVARCLAANGYICMSEEENRRSFNRGYTVKGFAKQVFHLHLRYDNDHDELYFRDYLNDHPAVAQQYERLKLSLWKQYEHDRDGYTDAKKEFVAEQTGKARRKYGDKYRTGADG